MHTHHFSFLWTPLYMHTYNLNTHTHSSRTYAYTQPPYTLCTHIQSYYLTFLYLSYGVISQLVMESVISCAMCLAACWQLLLLNASCSLYFCTLVLIRRMFAPCVCVCVCGVLIHIYIHTYVRSYIIYVSCSIIQSYTYFSTGTLPSSASPVLQCEEGKGVRSQQMTAVRQRWLIVHSSFRVSWWCGTSFLWGTFISSLISSRVTTWSCHWAGLITERVWMHCWRNLQGWVGREWWHCKWEAAYACVYRRAHVHVCVRVCVRVCVCVCVCACVSA